MMVAPVHVSPERVPTSASQLPIDPAAMSRCSVVWEMPPLFGGGPDGGPLGPSTGTATTTVAVGSLAASAPPVAAGPMTVSVHYLSQLQFHAVKDVHSIPLSVFCPRRRYHYRYRRPGPAGQ